MLCMKNLRNVEVLPCLEDNQGQTDPVCKDSARTTRSRRLFAYGNCELVPASVHQRAGSRVSGQQVWRLTPGRSH